MITKDEVQQMAHVAALHVTLCPRGRDVLSRLERLVLEAYQRGLEDGSTHMMEVRTQRDFEEIFGAPL